MKKIIQTQNLSFSYPDPSGERNQVLHDICLQIEEGEFVAIIGSNGSGKTTLARHFNGLLLPTSGKILINELDTREAANLPKIRRQIGMVFQQPEDQIVASVVEEDVAFGPANFGISLNEIKQRVESSLRAVNMWENRFRPPHLLSAGQMQRVALAGVLAMQPRCIIFDETTAMLDPAGRKSVLEIMSYLHKQGITILFITHFMEEACHADRVIALHRGKVVLDGSPTEVFTSHKPLIEAGLERPGAAVLADIIRKSIPLLPENILTLDRLLTCLPENNKSKQAQNDRTPFPHPAGSSGSNEYIQVSSLYHTYLKDTPLAQLALNDISLNAGEHQGHGLIGATGSGKSTLLQHLNGLLLPQQGSVRVGEFDLNNPDLDVIALRRSTGMVFQQADNQLFEQFAGDEIAYGLRLAGVSSNLRERVRWAMEFVGLDFDKYVDRFTFSLSGGEKRKVALASTLALQPENLLLDEPTAGLDPLSRSELLEKLKTLQSSGTTLLVSSHQMEDIAFLAQQITVCNAGKDVLAGSVDSVFQQIETLKQYHLEPPAATQVADALLQRGWNINSNILNHQQLADALNRPSEI